MRFNNKLLSSIFLNLTFATMFYVFITLKFETMLISKINSIGKEHLPMFYSLAVVIIGLGFILFPISKTFLKLNDNKTEYFSAVVLSSIVFIISLSLLTFSSTLPLIVFSAIFISLSLGYIGSWLFLSLSIFLNGTHYSGRVIGSSILMATAALIYFPFFVKSEIIQLLIIASFTAATVAIIHHLWRNEYSPPAKKVDYDISVLNRGMFSVAAIALMTLLSGISYGLFLRNSSEIDHTMRFYQVIHGLSALFFGILFDFKKRTYILLPLVVLVTLLVFSPLLLHFSFYSQIYGFIAWPYAGLFCLLYILPFIDIAPHTLFPEIWSSAGAITRYFISGLVLIPTMLLVEFIDSVFLAAINFIIAALLLKTVSFNNGKGAGIFTDEAEDVTKPGFDVEDSAENVLKSYEENISAAKSELLTTNITKFIEKYGLSAKEANALTLIISSGDEPLKIISDKEKISERTFQRYLTKIYEKTGTKTRSGLVSAYYKEISSLPADK